MPNLEPSPGFVSSANPGREYDYPEGVEKIVFAQFGFQSDGPNNAGRFIRDMREMMSGEDGPGRIERCHGFTKGVHEDVVLAYWLDEGRYLRWLGTSGWNDWWQSLPDDGPYGYWREVMTTDVSQIGGIFFGVDTADKRVGVTNLINAVPTDRWGYWGGYRDRLAISETDSMSAQENVTFKYNEVDSKGKRLAVIVPDDILYVREGAESTYITVDAEREAWIDSVQPALNEWIRYLAENPLLSGAFGTRDLVEQDFDTGADTEKYTQLIYFQSLRHLERAVRTQPSHGALYSSYMKMLNSATEAGETLALMIWVEQTLLKEGNLIAEYVNCDPRVGLLPWFPCESILSASVS